MGSRASLNKVMLIGNLTRDPEMRYTPSGAAVCTFGIATNRYYVASDGQKKEETEFIKIVSWNKLAELCSQLLVKGRKVYVEGRLQTRSWETPDGVSKQTTEVVIDDMRILDSKRDWEGASDEDALIHEEPPVAASAIGDNPGSDASNKGKKDEEVKKTKKEEKVKADSEDVDLEDLPF